MSGIQPFLDDVDPYVADFEEVLRVVELSSGFVLLPIGVPGPDLAEMLARWLVLAKKHPVIVNAPDDAQEWKKLATWLLEVQPEKNGVVVVIGSSEIAPEFSLAMRLVNERRDAMARHLDCPLLWCGPKEFLSATAEHAPDFWSVRAVERYIKPAERKPRSYPMPKATAERMAQKNELLQDAIRQGDRQSTEVLFLSRLRESMADESGNEFDSVLKSIPAELEQTDATYRVELGLMRAEMARRSGKIAEALEILDTLAECTKNPQDECRIDLLRGRVWETAGDGSKAFSAYRDAQKAAHEADKPLLYLLACIHRDTLDHRPDWSVSSLRDHRQAARKINDRPLETFTTALLAEATIRKHDRARAKRLLHEAFVLHEISKNDESLLFPGEVDEALRRVSKSVEHASTLRAITKERLSPSTLTIAVGVVLLLLPFAVFTYYAVTSIPRAQLHCFQRVDDKILCGESLERCEKLRVVVGNAAAGPCQKPQFATSE